jgi:hypothetical protein
MEKQIIALREQNKSLREIAKIVNLHRTTVSKILRKNGFDTSKIADNPLCNICGRTDNKNNRICNSCKTKIRRYRTKRKAVELLGGKCNRCGWDDHLAALEFHHTDDNKEFGFGSMANKKWEVIRKEAMKCELLCSNCHRIEHSSRYNESFVNEVNNYRGRLLE